jgi:hypothetical protein
VPESCFEAPADLKPVLALSCGCRGPEFNGPSGRLRHKIWVIAAVHASGEPGVSLIGVTGAGMTSVGAKTSGVNKLQPDRRR